MPMAFQLLFDIWWSIVTHPSYRRLLFYYFSAVFYYFSAVFCSLSRVKEVFSEGSLKSLAEGFK